MAHERFCRAFSLNAASVRGWKISDCPVLPTTETRPETHCRYDLPDCQPVMRPVSLGFRPGQPPRKTHTSVEFGVLGFSQSWVPDQFARQNPSRFIWPI